jgi:hypothetical protein
MKSMEAHFTESHAAGRVPRIVEVDGTDPIRADLLKVSKDGKRIRVSFWNRWGKLQSMWTYATGWRPL